MHFTYIGCIIVHERDLVSRIANMLPSQAFPKLEFYERGK